MAATDKTWSNNNPPPVEDADLNGFKDENNNLIAGSGQSINIGDKQQTHKAVANYVGAGDFFNYGGTVNAITLAPLGSRVAPTFYATGLRVRFNATSPNTGSATVDVTGLGVKEIREQGASTNALAPGAVSGYMELTYDGTHFRITGRPTQRVESYWGRGVNLTPVAVGAGSPNITGIANLDSFRYSALV